MGSGDRETLVRICDPAGRPRGTGFVADDRGTVVTSHEAVDGLTGAVLHGAPGLTCRAESDDITALPDLGLALVRTDGLDVPPLPISARDRIETGTYVRVAALGWREARVLGESPATYTTGGSTHLLGAAVELAIGTQGSDALRQGGSAAGGPVVDASTGAVLGVLGTALRGTYPAAGLAVPLRGAALAPLLRRNAATVPGYGKDLNLAGVLELTATSLGLSAEADLCRDPVERADIVSELAAFPDGGAPVLGLVGAPGTGRTTELTALAARRARGAQPAPTLWLRGADLRAEDTSVADAMARTVRQAGRIVGTDGMDGATPERIAALAAAAGQPLLVLLDSPEEMPPRLARALPEWTAGTAGWLRGHRARMVVACRPEYWEQAVALQGPGSGCVRIGDLPPREAERARLGYGIPEGMLTARDAGHPLTLRMLAEVRAALPGGVDGRPTREDVFAAYLDLMCLRIAVRIAATERPAPRGTAVRRLAATVSGQVHEAARRCLGPGQGELDRTSFEELFPWRTGWASAVLTERLLVPAGSGYRFAHGELADWVQGEHLDVDAALYALVHRRHEETPGGPATRLPSRPGAESGGTPAPGTEVRERPLTVPRHRIGPVVQALLLLGRREGTHELGRRLRELIEELDRLQDASAAGAPVGPRVPRPGRGPEAAEPPAPLGDAEWWAAHLLGDVLLGVPDCRPYIGVLRLLADRITLLSVRSGGPRHIGGFRVFDSAFWERLRLGEGGRLDLLRRLVPADGAPGGQGGDRYLDAAARRLAAEPRSVQPLLCRWFSDERPLPSEAHAELRPTVAGAAQALLYTRRALAVDDLAEALVATAHPRADELLVALAEDEPAALCRAVDRWAHDDRPERRAAAADFGVRAAVHARTGPDRELLRYAALALLARPADSVLHGAALALLVRDPHTRTRHLPCALALFAAEPSSPLLVAALAEALPTHPEPVFAAFEAALRRRPRDAAEILGALAGISTPAPARRAAALVHEYVDRHPAGAVHAAAFVDRRLEDGPAARSLLFPLVTGLLRGHPRQVRVALAPVLAAPGGRGSRAMRAELLDVLLEYERYEARDGLEVLEALLRAAALGSDRRTDPRTRDLVRRTGLLLVRTPEGAACFDRHLVELAGEVPGFAGQLADWLALAPQEWALLVGPSTRHMVQKLAAPMPMQAARAGHGSLRPVVPTE
ncbi:trypsin-like peptidase domain-containing protein [Streptomyces sp. NPDC090053]|uniref:trypsin-like peptidase domain-containing protein n=1 Tax=Streptomyces sp. NPDC090053 TaxID=3365932 RepID=UPI003811653E